MSQDQKREAIVLAAEKRFAHFTVSKTTMAEIAADLGISKPLLYYYFPDKLNLYAAVLGHIIERHQKEYASELLSEIDAVKNIMRYLKKRKDFIIQYFNIIEFAQTAVNRSPDEVKSIFGIAKTSEFNAVLAIINKARKNGQVKTKGPRRLAQLFLDCLEGLRRVFFLKKGITVFPEKEQFEALYDQEKEFAVIFFNGLKS